MNDNKKTSSLLVVVLIAGLGAPGYAQDDPPAPVTAPPTRAEFNKLQAEVRDQRSLIIQMLQTEQQRYDMLLRLLQTQNGGSASALAVPAPSTPEAAPAEGAPVATGGGKKTRAAAPAEIEHRLGSVEGKVTVSGGEAGEIYVYVENVKAPPVRNKTVEIRQDGKQFVPRVAVVQAGTSVVFPNFDSVYHNVFSNSPHNAFDLGSYRAGDKPRSVSLASPGVVDVFCNMHQKMNASILVVPNTLYAKVRADGSFRLENVPVGPRRIVAWSPNARPAQQRVEVTASGTQVSFGLAYQERGAHSNKLGQAYGSYRD